MVAWWRNCLNWPVNTSHGNRKLTQEEGWATFCKRMFTFPVWLIRQEVKNVCLMGRIRHSKLPKCFLSLTQPGIGAPKRPNYAHRKTTLRCWFSQMNKISFPQWLLQRASLPLPMIDMQTSFRGVSLLTTPHLQLTEEPVHPSAAAHTNKACSTKPSEIFS